MSKKSEISFSEWHEALGNLTPNDPGYTTAELAGEFKVTYDVMQKRIMGLQIKNKIIKGKSVRDGRIVTVYQLK